MITLLQHGFDRQRYHSRYVPYKVKSLQNIRHIMLLMEQYPIIFLFNLDPQIQGGFCIILHFKRFL